VSFAAITLCVASERVRILVVYFVMTQSGNFWIHPPRIRMLKNRCRGGCLDVRELHDDELHNLNSSQNVIRAIRSRVMRGTVHIRGVW
jgi:hypothetical protein